VDATRTIIEAVQEAAGTRNLESKRSLADLVEVAASEYKQKLRVQYAGPPEGMANYFYDHRFIFMLAHYLNGEPCLFKFTSEDPTPYLHRNETRYLAVGIADGLAEYLLRHFEIKNALTFQGVAIATFVVGEAKADTRYCGGRVQIGIALQSSKNRVSFLADKTLIDAATGQVELFLPRYRKALNKEFAELAVATLMGWGPVILPGDPDSPSSPSPS